VSAPSGESWECSDLFIADASLFPSSLGINPMVTVAALAHQVAGTVSERFPASTDDDTDTDTEGDKGKRGRYKSDNNTSTTW
jgi:choline dehydrogenase-like flavoprotein